MDIDKYRALKALRKGLVRLLFAGVFHSARKENYAATLIGRRFTFWKGRNSGVRPIFGTLLYSALYGMHAAERSDTAPPLRRRRGRHAPAGGRR